MPVSYQKRNLRIILVNGAGKDEPKAIKTISDIDWKEEYGKDISKIDVLVDSYFNDKGRI